MEQIPSSDVSSPAEKIGASCIESTPSRAAAQLQCPCCGASQFAPMVRGLRSIYADQPYDVARCGQCGHGVTAPVPTPEELDAIYGRVYLYDVHRAVLGEKEYRARLLAGEIARLRPQAGPFRVLEIGSMFGALLSELARRGIMAQGVELSQAPVQYCRERNLEVSCESAEQFAARAPSSRFQVIVLSHVLEHLLEPRTTIRQLSRHLTPGGHLVVCVPNHRCWHAKLAGRHWGWWQVPVHVNHFCESSARRFFESLEFGDIRTTVRGGDSLTLLLTVMNALGATGVSRQDALSPARRATIKALSILLRGYHRIGGDELVIVGRLSADQSPG
jgi:SAM-dependent methyltransferase